MADRNPQMCWCETCRPNRFPDIRMVICPMCGNKRCPHATDHRNTCTASNEPGQPGSSYEHVGKRAPAPALGVPLPFSPYLVFEYRSPTERHSWTAYNEQQMRDYAAAVCARQTTALEPIGVDPAAVVSGFRRGGDHAPVVEFEDKFATETGVSIGLKLYTRSALDAEYTRGRKDGWAACDAIHKLGETAQPDARINEFSKAEWFDVARTFNPSLSWEQFEQQWDEFQASKARRSLS